MVFLGWVYQDFLYIKQRFHDNLIGIIKICFDERKEGQKTLNK